MNNENVFSVRGFSPGIVHFMVVWSPDSADAADTAFRQWQESRVDLVEVFNHRAELIRVVDGSRALAAADLCEGLLAFVVTVTDLGEVYVMESRQGANGCDQRRPLARVLNIAEASKFCIIEQSKILGWVAGVLGCEPCQGFGGRFDLCADGVHRWRACDRCNARAFPGSED